MAGVRQWGEASKDWGCKVWGTEENSVASLGQVVWEGSS